MSHKEMVAGIQVLGAVLVGSWLVWDAMNGGLGASLAGLAGKLLWVIAAVIGFNIVVTILGTILVSIVQRVEFRDEPSDERDMAIDARSLKYGGIVTSALAALALIPLAMGAEPMVAVYALFAAPLIGGTISAALQLYFYRVG